MFDNVERIDELSTDFLEQDIWVSPDGRRVTFTSNRGGLYQIWEASR